MTLLGLVNWFDPEKKFGTLITLDEGELFLHINNLENPSANVKPGTVFVCKKLNENHRRNRVTAVNCRNVSTFEDFAMIMTLLKRQDQVRSQGPRRGTYTLWNLKVAATSQLFKSQPVQAVQQYIIRYFDRHLPASDFIVFAEFIEQRIIKNFKGDDQQSLLQNTFSHFAIHAGDEIKFHVWKEKKFILIQFSGNEEDLVPIAMLRKFSALLNKNDMERLINYSSGQQFVHALVLEKIRLSGQLPASHIVELFSLVKFLDAASAADIQVTLNKQLREACLQSIRESARKIGTIKNETDLNQYLQLEKLIDKNLDAQAKEDLQAGLTEMIISNAPPDLAGLLWRKEILPEVSEEAIEQEFLRAERPVQLAIFKKAPAQMRWPLLEKYVQLHDPEKAFNFLESFLRNHHSFLSHVTMNEHWFDESILTQLDDREIVDQLHKWISRHVDKSESTELFFKGLYRVIPLQTALDLGPSLPAPLFEKLLNYFRSEEVCIVQLLNARLSMDNIESVRYVLKVAKEYLSAGTYHAFELQTVAATPTDTCIRLWEAGNLVFFPAALMKDYFTHEPHPYNNITFWILQEMASPETLADFFLEYLMQQEPVTDRFIFYKQYYHIRFAADCGDDYLDKILALRNDFYNTILWSMGKTNLLSFETLASKYIYFLPDEQVDILRRLFMLRATGALHLNMNDLESLTRADANLYHLNQTANQDILLDISTEVVIRALKSYSTHQKFLIEGELVSMVLHHAEPDKKKRFRISEYFEDCRGRLTPKFDPYRRGEIRKVVTGDNQFYFAISFEYSVHLVKLVKEIPGRRWNVEQAIWTAPSTSEQQVLEFARENRFFLDFPGNFMANNPHMITYQRGEKPAGISYCVGRAANRVDDRFNKPFWWCANHQCFGKCETIHAPQHWKSYTLLDFCEILGLNTNEINRMGDMIDKGHYYLFVAQINRFNRLLAKMYCRSCDRILYPVDHAHFAAHSVVRFCCENENCNEYKSEVYLNHCLNGQCNNIIDSRTSHRCTNGLFICDQCGSCCSHAMLKRRYDNLVTTNGYIHDNLVEAIDNKLGHLERAEYFCYKCAREMPEVEPEVFRCAACNITYETTKYRFKREHLHLRRNGFGGMKA